MIKIISTGLSLNQAGDYLTHKFNEWQTDMMKNGDEIEIDTYNIQNNIHGVILLIQFKFKQP